MDCKQLLATIAVLILLIAFFDLDKAGALAALLGMAVRIVDQ